jgi:hypothetical protein
MEHVEVAAARGFFAGLVEKAEVDGVGHGGVARVFGMEVVAAVGLGGEDEGIGGVAGGFIEVDGAVEDVAGEDPGVDGFPNLLALIGEVACTFVGSEGCAVDLNAAFVGSTDELGESVLKLLGGELILRLVGIVESADVVDAFHHDDETHARLAEDVAIETGEGVGANAVDEDAIATDAFVEDGEAGGCGVVVEAGGEVVGPAMILIVGGVGAVGDGIAERDDGSGMRIDGLDVDAFEEIPGWILGGRAERWGGDFVAVLDEVGLLGRAVGGDVGDGLDRQVEAHGDVGEGGRGEVNGIAEDHSSGGNDDGSLAAEDEGMERLGLNGVGAGAEGHAGGVDAERLGAEFIGETDAEGLSGERRVDDLAEGGVDEGGHGVPRIAAVGCRGPGTDPRVRLGRGVGLSGDKSGDCEQSR